MRMILTMLIMSFFLNACENGLQERANDKRSSGTIGTQGLFLEWTALNDKYESKLKFKDVN